MKPYYQDEWVTIYHGDCREILPQLPKVDLVLTDFPYGNNTDYESYKDTQYNLLVLISETMPLLLRSAELVATATGIGNMFKFPEPSWVIAWYIGQNGQLSTPWGFNCWQPILVWGKDPYLARGLGRRQDAIQHQFEPASTLAHPCPKPIKTWKKLMMRLSPATGETILDPFLGSGTTAVAAKALNRKCIGIEIEEKYCKIAADRCSQDVMRLDV